MQADPFTGQATRLRGGFLPGPVDRAALQHDHERRLEALARLGAAAAQCGVGEDSDRDLVTLGEDEVALLEPTGGEWAELGAAIRAFRALLPLRVLGAFGFPDGEGIENPLEEPNDQLRRIGGGVEAWAFAATRDGSAYKFYLPREGKRIGSAFGFRRGDEAALAAEAGLGDYRALLEKLLLIHALGGMATEVVAITPEGILVAKQAVGEPLPQGDDMSGSLPAGLIEIPSRFLRANRDHPRLFFHGGQAWLVADLHARNFVRCSDGALRVIDLVAAPWPPPGAHSEIDAWIERVRHDPGATALPGARDEDL
ncbi:MAG: hypothetical protein JNL39_03070 [Opitutaceae bacterium]|nr:hypothetical protein [Opitutaceae bacterium]